MDNLSIYVEAIQKSFSAGNATEHTYRASLENLINSFDPTIKAVNEPKRVACGAPDFIVTKNQVPLGYIETKNLDEPLSKIARSTQMMRYRESLCNLILTDYLEFWWYIQGEHRLTARLASLDDSGKIVPEPENAQSVSELLNAFLTAQVPVIGTSKELAFRMASIAKLIRETIEQALKGEQQEGGLHIQLQGFRDVLIHDLTENQFADMYAQTICYGLFAARCNVADSGSVEFTREHAAYDLPKTNPFLRTMFTYIAGPELDERITWVVDDLVELLRRANIANILEDFGHIAKGEDPVVHFYETFLANYNPTLREMRGVYYTPDPVVEYIVGSIDEILKSDFGLDKGLADPKTIQVKNKEVHKVQILDPAAGTGTFLHGVIRHIHESFQGNEGLWPGYVSAHLLPRLYGFELLMAPYAVAHMKLGMLLKETGYDFGSNERLNVFLTNTLEKAEFHAQEYFASFIAKEANRASEVKQDVPVMVVLGNPPYSGHSANQGKWIKELVDDYKYVDGEPLGERNPKWLNDDYVKFIRFSQHRIERTGYGILAFISNHGYLDNPTFRGMRQSLMETFDDIYILDLHGNAKKKETCPDGSKDDNVFDIMQGVAIGIFVRRPDRAKKSTIRHADCYGIRKTKYKWLLEHKIQNTKWKKLKPHTPFYLFTRHDVRLSREFKKYVNVCDIFPYNNMGITTGDDEEYISFSETDYKNTFKESKKNIFILYRPFDRRVLHYDPKLLARARHKLNVNLIYDNKCLITLRRPRNKILSNFFVTNIPTDKCAISSLDNAQIFPLYIYPKKISVQETFIDLHSSYGKGENGRKPNLNPEFVSDFSGRLGLEFVSDGKGDLKKTFGPEDIFHYAYAVFHSPAYRTRYAEFLKIDFPRLPMTSDTGLFRTLCAYGEELTCLHLLEKVPEPIVNYPIAGSNLVDRPRYCAPIKDQPGRVWINNEQYFEGVPPEVWEFYIGGYQVCEKWLKDRKERKLTYDDINHYRNVVTALHETIRLMDAIDSAIGKWPIE